jgi:hypothetical protein
MKDKLVKTNKKATYYRVKNVAIAFACLLGLGLALVLPFKLSEQNATVPRADTTTEVDNSSTSEIEMK